MKIAYQHIIDGLEEIPSIVDLSEKLFQLGHEHEIDNDVFDFEFTPNNVAPFFLECFKAISLDEITGLLFNDAIATDALSIILLITISIAALFNFALSLAISAIFHAS